MNLKLAETKDLYALCVMLRTQEYIIERNFPANNEFQNEDRARHYIGLIDGQPIATARYYVEGKRAQIERVTISRECTGQGLGTQLMAFMVDQIKEREAGVTHIDLSTEDKWIPFYESCGFERIDKTHEELGYTLQHMRMVIR